MQQLYVYVPNNFTRHLKLFVNPQYYWCYNQFLNNSTPLSLVEALNKRFRVLCMSALHDSVNDSHMTTQQPAFS